MSDSGWGNGIKEKDMAQRESLRSDKRMRILRVSAESFNRNGYYQTSLDALAAELNVTKPTLYYYVKNKDDILDGILAIAIDQLRTLIAETAESKTSGLEKLHTFFLRYSEIVTDVFGTCLILMRINAPEEKFREPYHALSAEVFSAVRGLIESGIADNSIADCNPKFMASAMIASLNEAVYWHIAQGRQSPSSAAPGYWDTFSLALKS